MNINLLTFDNLAEVPIDEKIREIINPNDFSKWIWNSTGLPLYMAKYSVLGKQLYLDELPSGESKVEKQEWTGEVMASILVLNKNGDNHYVVTLYIIFLKGQIYEIKSLETKELDKIKYEEDFTVFEGKYKKTYKRANSRWYKSYIFVLRWIFFLPMLICSGLLDFMEWIFKKITL